MYLVGWKNKNCSAIGAGFQEVYEGFRFTKILDLKIVEVNMDYESVVRGLEGEGNWNVNWLALIKIFLMHFVCFLNITQKY